MKSSITLVCAALVALLTAGCLLVARFFELGFLADFLSQTVLVGFLTGVGFQVGIAVLGWFFIKPHADLSVAERTGDYVLTAAPGIGWQPRA